MTIQQEIQDQRVANMLQAIDELRHLFEVISSDGVNDKAYQITYKRIDAVLTRLSDLANKTTS